MDINAFFYTIFNNIIVLTHLSQTVLLLLGINIKIYRTNTHKMKINRRFDIKFMTSK